jgi:hypothetical protein
VKRTITGRPGSRTMTLGDLRQFIGSLDGLPDEATVKAKVSFGKQLRSITVEEEDSGFHDFVKAVKPDRVTPPSEPRQVRGGKQAKETTKA